jgi:hypothetical protein
MKFGRSTKTDSSQNRFGGKILKISPDGKLLHVFEIAAMAQQTLHSAKAKKIVRDCGEDPNDPQAKGSIVKIRNVK